jgi:hypothetical protein
MESIAYHLRQDGKYFPITMHIYCSGDGTLMGEAEAAEFVIATKSKGIELAKQVLDVWFGLMIHKRYPTFPDNLDINRLIIPAVSTSQSLMEYALSDSEILAIHRECDNYTTMGEFKEYLNELDINTLQTDMMTLLNQEFCRVRYGGIYDSHGEPELWFRISSVGVSWTNNIYNFVSTFKNRAPVEYITICRDRTSPDDNATGFVEIDDQVKVYKADDGVLYLHMPIDEYLSEVHSTRDIFTATDTTMRFPNKYYNYIWKRLCHGDMLHSILDDLFEQGVVLDAAEVWDTMTQMELMHCQ